MKITVRKATEADIAKLRNNPTWGCGVSEFDWHYDSEEICWLTEGEVTLTYDDPSRAGSGSVSFGAGDYCEFPAGLSCVWKVTKPVKKHYEFR
ncbi:MAG: cupin domain-containing protein [Defluviitaleaceae bacterium]|nr:cupin domain-containing protein [Defluviitaleaceae bacterium]MCL2238388.1 cupin domain-containing protein [Defluviitaleaceae bacterium]